MLNISTLSGGRIASTGTAARSNSGLSNPRRAGGSRPRLVDTTNVVSTVAPSNQQLLPVLNEEVVSVSLTDIERKMNTEMNKLDRLHFTAMSIEPYTEREIKTISTVNVTRLLNDQDEANTVNDHQMGSSGERHCDKCNLSESCSGHYGRITFAEPIFNPIYMKDKTITHILNSVCSDCFQTYMTEEQMKSLGIDRMPAHKRLSEIASQTYQVCPRTTKGGGASSRVAGCRKPVRFDHNKSKEQGKAYYKGEGGIDEFFTAEKVLEIFSNISDHDAKMLGFRSSSVLSRFIMSAMLVPPLQVRPVRIIRGLPNANELTIALNAIVKANIELTNAKQSNIHRQSATVSVSNANSNLYKMVSEYQKLISDEIQGKEGRVRGELMRKRGNFCARGVIGPATNVALDEIVIPRHMKYDLTPEETVTYDNIEYLTNLIKQGQITFITNGPGRNGYVGLRRKVMADREYNLVVGDKVERLLQDGDYVVLNRQPSLHKHNLMGFKVVLQERNTIGIHLSVTTSMHADFDGDEADIWLPLSKEARSEVYERMFSCRNLMTSKSNQPIVHLVYDSLTAAYLLTAPIHNGKVIEIPQDVFFNAISTFTSTSQLRTLMKRLNNYGFTFHRPGSERITSESQNSEGAESAPVREVPSNIEGEFPTISGAALFSALLPEDFNFDKGGVSIREGILVRGSIGGETVGGAHRSIVQELNKYYGWERASAFITDATWALRIFLDYHGFSMGIEDCEYIDKGEIIIPSKVKGGPDEVKESKVAILEALAAAEAANAALGPPTGDPLLDRERERRIKDIVDQPRTVGIQVVSSAMPVNNNIRVMSKEGGGAKGSSFNTLQMNAFLGQQYYDNKRPERSMTDGQRTLASFKTGDYSLASEGLVSHSFMEGLTPSELFFHFMGSREGLADTTVKAAPVGQLQRSIAKSMESVIVFPDKSIRTHDGKIIQFAYGEDGFDAEYLLRVSTPSMKERSFFVDLGPIANSINSEYGWHKAV